MVDNSSMSSVVFLVVFISLSAFFSAAETAFSSFNQIRMKTFAEEGNKKAKLVLRLSEEYNKTISTILVGNNIVNIATASLSTMLFVNWFGSSGVPISTVVTTIVVLIFGEITPKSLAKESPEKITLFVAPILNVLCILLTPVNYLFTQWKKLISKLFKISSSTSSITENELRALVNEAEQEGVIEAKDKKLLNSAFDFSDGTVEEILIPRVDIIAVSDVTTMEELTEKFIEIGHSRILIYHETIDNIIGVIHLRDLFEANYKKLIKIDDIITPVLFVLPSFKIHSLLSNFQNNKIHIAVIVDEYGGTIGMITMEDILEELVGDIWDEHDEIEEDIQKIADNKYLVSGQTDTEKILDFLSLPNLSERLTVGGWIIEKLDKIPKEGDNFIYENFKIIVAKMNGRRIITCVFEQIEVDENAEIIGK